MSRIDWTGRRSDYTANVDGYTLRVEMMGRGCWQWTCYLPNGGVGRCSHECSESEAKQAAIEAMNENKSRQ
jgi:hypothetical protein